MLWVDFFFVFCKKNEALFRFTFVANVSRALARDIWTQKFRVEHSKKCKSLWTTWWIEMNIVSTIFRHHPYRFQVSTSKSNTIYALFMRSFFSSYLSTLKTHNFFSWTVSFFSFLVFVHWNIFFVIDIFIFWQKKRKHNLWKRKKHKIKIEKKTTTTIPEECSLTLCVRCLSV